MIDGREVDFIIGNYAVEIDGHAQNAQRNGWLLSSGYVPIHYSNHALRHNRGEVEKDITNRYGIYRKSLASSPHG